ncbi:hypothetical protein [Brevundimonas sp. UBA2416]|mgnify:CR=1 FL=1|uniref:hypothetical protein n=1 Tax=Brevundimonas sp. UBA2416 TaxID=1946124 RepID=UPI0025BD0767|nr:hypothetical protein [Brevundimonas sp. UBA2416]HRJ63726.1 hypothetical protein [Brevundimonas sp.]
MSLCASEGSQSIILLVPSRPQLKNATLAGVIGVQSAKALSKGDTLSLPGGITLSADGWKTFRIGAKKTVVIAYYTDDTALELIEGVANIVGLVAVPDLVGRAPQWVARWNPTVPGQPAQAPAVIVADSRVVKALESLTASANLGQGMLGPIDKQSAQDTFRILRNKGHSAPVGSVKSWAIQHGWKPKAAGELEVIAQRAFGLSGKPSLARVVNAQLRYDRWV